MNVKIYWPNPGWLWITDPIDLVLIQICFLYLDTVQDLSEELIWMLVTFMINQGAYAMFDLQIAPPFVVLCSKDMYKLATKD